MSHRIELSVKRGELVTVGNDARTDRAIKCIGGAVSVRDIRVLLASVRGGDGVVGDNLGTAVKQAVDNRERTRAASVVRSGLEREPKYGNAVARDIDVLIEEVEHPSWLFLVDTEDRIEYELSDAIDLLIQSGRTIDAVRMDGWRLDIGYPEDRDKAEERLRDGSIGSDSVNVDSTSGATASDQS